MKQVHMHMHMHMHMHKSVEHSSSSKQPAAQLMWEKLCS